ncbi:Sir2 family NAD-dependent protein deacetylase [Helcobacillus massiliensis]|uniref:Sir2 family NAD-dependent protein deacetylase n=1 Tax=Helcobacillus massiliensis TaxID=521392 RepID=UPI0025558076|nr:Sir2 family NAD-dependent protein deacetylase [Helcobacillus massiliensis]MDK7742620.1 Sir2 family NAD-dependent protein deacetylase [Helcobacillus massiliensis]WOO92559.1 Sir2 family NAD-dependent protein deacetylase [Helcobacillus massiliensis]
MRIPPAGHAGSWFATASTTHSAFGPDDAPAPSVAPAAPRTGRGLPRMPAWGPMDSAEYGRTSPPEEIERAVRVLAANGPVVVLTGAGMSTDSGLPDYRGRTATARQPMTIHEFTGSDLSRRRYWARSTVGWRQFLQARPNQGHRLLAAIQAVSSPFPISAVITQNVDGLHEAAGTKRVIPLHGQLSLVTCLGCGHLSSRPLLHERMLLLNPDYAARIDALADQVAQAPDGDADVDRTHDFRYPLCGICGGMLKPDVVFFGEAAHPQVVRDCYAAVEEAGSVLVLGSSLTVQSGLRFVRAAVKAGRPVVVVNDGPTRADGVAAVRIAGRITDVLQLWCGAEKTKTDG